MKLGRSELILASLAKTQPLGTFLILRFTQPKYLAWFPIRDLNAKNAPNHAKLLDAFSPMANHARQIEPKTLKSFRNQSHLQDGESRI